MKILFAALLAASVCAPAGATTLFSDNFNDYAGGGFATQTGTGLLIGAVGTLGNWDVAGANAAHAVDRTGSGDWAVMLYGGPQGPNTVTTKTAFAANALGSLYSVSFESAAAAFGSNVEGNTTGDILRFDVLRTDGSSVFNYIFDAADWTGAATNPFTMSSFTYAGDGTGNVKLRIVGLSTTFSNHFGGAVDTVSVDSVPEPAMLGLFGMGAIGLWLTRRRRAV